MPERLSEEGEKRIAKCETLYSKNSHKHLKGGGRRILQCEDSKVKTQKIDQMQYWKDIDQVDIYNMELMSHHGSLEQPQTSMIRKRNSSCNWGTTGCIEFLQTIKITYSKQRLVRDINKLKQKYRQRRKFYLLLTKIWIKLSQAERWMKVNYSLQLWTASVL